MRLIILSFVAFQAVPYCSTLSHIWHDYIVINELRSSRKMPFFFSCQILMKLEFSLQIFAIRISVLMKIHSVGAVLFPADGRTDGLTHWHIDEQEDMTKLTVAFRSFAKEPKIVRYTTQCMYVFRKAIGTDTYFATQH